MQLGGICRIGHANSLGVVHLLFGNQLHILRRQPATVVLYRNLHIAVASLGINIHPAAGRRVLAGILGQGIEHEHGQCLIRLQTQAVGRNYIQTQLLHFETPRALAQQVEELVQSKVLDIQTQYALPHFYPKGKYLVVLVDGCHQLIHIFVALAPLFLTGLCLATE